MVKANYKPALLCVVSALFLMMIGFYNGYPLYGGDTQSYLFMAFTKELAPDRPPFYGDFIRITSLWTSLWFTIFCQSLILSCLLVKYISLFKPAIKSFRFGFICLFSIASFTCVSWVSSNLIPDIFTGILLLAILLYLFDTKASKLLTIVYVLIMVIAVIVHNSHFLLVFLFSASILIYSSVKRNKIWIRKSIGLLSIGVFFYFLMCTINYNHKRGFTFSPSSQVFIVANFASSGILDKYLEDSCGKKNLRLCTCKGQIPHYTYAFMWPDPSNPLSKIGVWDSCTQEFKGIVYDVFTTPEYLKMYIQKSAAVTLEQLCEIGNEKPFAFAPDDWKILALKTYFEDEYKICMASKQNLNELDYTKFHVVYVLFFVLSSIIVLLLYSPSTNKEIYLIYSCILLFFVMNAFVTSNFSMVCPRFQNRIFWILPATNTILILKYFWERNQTKFGEKPENLS